MDQEKAEQMAASLTIAGIEGCIRNAKRKAEANEQAQIALTECVDAHQSPNSFQQMRWSDRAEALAASAVMIRETLENAQEAMKIRLARCERFPSWVESRNCG
jgi:hypothetical protein